MTIKEKSEFASQICNKISQLCIYCEYDKIRGKCDDNRDNKYVEIIKMIYKLVDA